MPEEPPVLASWVWSGRWDLNPRQLAWEARTLPLSYARSMGGILRWPLIPSQERHQLLPSGVNSTIAIFLIPILR